MLYEGLYLIAGTFLLYYGSSWLVNGASEIALSLAIRPVVVGLTVVAVATSAPELLVSLVAATGGSSGVSIGNILGSNVINIALVLGLSALVEPISINRQLIRRELPYMTFASVLFWVLCMDGSVSRIDGLILLSVLTAFIIYCIFHARDNNQNYKNTTKNDYLRNGFFIIVGLISLAVGADWVVSSAIHIARSFDLTEVFIGITIVAVGTSLPELATSVVAAVKKQSDISVGNIVGSNLFNVCLVMGIVGLFNPIQVNSGLNRFEFPAMIIITLLLYLFAVTRRKISRLYGSIFIICFLAYNIIVYLISG